MVLIVQRYVTSLESRLENLEQELDRVHRQHELASSDYGLNTPNNDLPRTVDPVHGSNTSPSPSMPETRDFGMMSASAVDPARQVLHARRQVSHEILPHDAGGFDWIEGDPETPSSQDGMAALSLNPAGGGYLGL